MKMLMFCRIQNLHISQTYRKAILKRYLFCRIQNLHISQTTDEPAQYHKCFVEFKIYISLKLEVKTPKGKLVL